MINNGDQIVVTVSGAVNSAGKHLLPVSTSVQRALEIAGGPANHSQMRASGVVTVRRPLPLNQVKVWRSSLANTSDLQEFLLESGDLVVFQWDIDIVD